ncbi:hypothetical protein CIW84_06700 [Heyndrickxia coagulans]|nr:hypothetical protein CIW84_06700 [Heyndrickxia coagulans]
MFLEKLAKILFVCCAVFALLGVIYLIVAD